MSVLMAPLIYFVSFNCFIFVENDIFSSLNSRFHSGRWLPMEGLGPW